MRVWAEIIPSEPDPVNTGVVKNYEEDDSSGDHPCVGWMRLWHRWRGVVWQYGG